MIVQSPLKRQDIRPNLRAVPVHGQRAKKKNHIHSSGKPASKSKPLSIPRIKPWKVIAASIVLGGLGLLYLTHVFATQKLLNETHQLEAQFNKSRSQFDELKLQYERMIGPAEIYQKAEAQGFINGGPAEKVIIIKK